MQSMTFQTEIFCTVLIASVLDKTRFYLIACPDCVKLISSLTETILNVVFIDRENPLHKDL